jgi:hypothetical protein
MAATAALLAISVCAVLWRGKGSAAPSIALPRATATLSAMEAQPSEPPVYAPPADSLLTAQLEVGQTFHVQTRTAKYVLTLRDPVTGLYDAVRTGRKKCGNVVEERFKMLFKGTFVPYVGLQFREFIPGGNLSYQKVRGGDVLDMSPSSTIQRILYTLPSPYQQAC